MVPESDSGGKGRSGKVIYLPDGTYIQMSPTLKEPLEERALKPVGDPEEAGIMCGLGYRWGELERTPYQAVFCYEGRLSKPSFKSRFLALWDAASGVAWALYDAADYSRIESCLSWSRDGEKICFAGCDAIHVLDISALKVETVFDFGSGPFPRESAYGFASARIPYLVFTGRGLEVLFYRYIEDRSDRSPGDLRGFIKVAPGEQATVVFDGAVEPIGSDIRYAPAARRVFFLHSDDKRILGLDIDGGEPAVVCEAGHVIHSFDVSHDGRYLLVCGEQSFLADIEKNTATNLPYKSRDGVLSPDARLAVVKSKAPDDSVFLVDLGTGRAELLLSFKKPSGGAFDGQPSFTPDGRLVWLGIRLFGEELPAPGEVEQFPYGIVADLEQHRLTALDAESVDRFRFRPTTTPHPGFTPM